LGETPVVKVEETLDRHSVPRVLGELTTEIGRRPGRLILDLGAVERFDSAGMGAVAEGLRQAREVGVDLRLRGLSQQMLDFFSLVSVSRLTTPEPPAERIDPISRLGALVIPGLDSLAGIASIGAGVLRAIFVDPFRGRRIRLDRTVLEIDLAAIGAMPIISLIAFLLGLILAMQAYVQLRVWGAEIYMADMVGVSVVTEIGPLMTAIILAARSASSNAAQLGSMAVGEEIDALVQMGVDPLRFLVVPKVIALAFSVVALGVLFDVIAMSGGALFGYLVADIDPAAYRAQTQTALNFPDFSVAMAKSVAFGLMIGVIGCALGLRVQGGSTGVGKATTNSVVLSVFVIIVVDAVFVTMQRMIL
jgi:phospholipid/cholesterol/gamma-HCH transport system permease protein